MTLTEFLLDRIAEDEAANWRVGYNPTRVLAECEAKRRIVEIHAIEPGDAQEGCYRCNWTDDYGFGVDGPCDTLRALATPYADHPDYREAWKP